MGELITAITELMLGPLDRSLGVAAGLAVPPVQVHSDGSRCIEAYLFADAHEQARDLRCYLKGLRVLHHAAQDELDFHQQFLTALPGLFLLVTLAYERIQLGTQLNEDVKLVQPRALLPVL